MLVNIVLALAQIMVGVISDTPLAPGTVATPTFNNGTGTYNNDVSVTISDGTSGATLCYTTNGTNPAATTPGTCSTGSTYSTAVTISATGTVLKALATKAGMTNSAIQSATYTLTVGAITDSPGAGTYSSTQSVTLGGGSTSDYKCYTTDGSTPAGTGSTCSTGTHYTGAFNIAATSTLKAIGYKTNYNASAEHDALYTIATSLTGTYRSSASCNTVGTNCGGTFAVTTGDLVACYVSTTTVPTNTLGCALNGVAMSTAAGPDVLTGKSMGQLFYKVATSTNASMPYNCTVTDATNYASCAVVAITPSAPPTLDQHPAVGTYSMTTAMTTATTASISGQIVVAGFGVRNEAGDQNYTPAAGWLNLTNAFTYVGRSDSVIMWRNVSTSGTYTGTITSSTNVSGVGHIASFR